MTFFISLSRSLLILLQFEFCLKLLFSFNIHRLKRGRGVFRRYFSIHTVYIIISVPLRWHLFNFLFVSRWFHGSNALIEFKNIQKTAIIIFYCQANFILHRKSVNIKKCWHVFPFVFSQVFSLIFHLHSIHIFIELIRFIWSFATAVQHQTFEIHADC